MLRPLVIAAILAAAPAFALAAPAETPMPSPDRPMRLSISDGTATHFLSPDTLVRDGDAASVWSVMVFKTTTPNLPPNLAGAWSLQRFTCSARIGEADTAYLLNPDMQIYQTAGHEAGKARIQHAIPPTSPQERAYRFACLGDASVLQQSVANLREAFTLARSD